MTFFEQLKATPKWQQRRELVRECNDAAALLAWLPLEIEGWVRAPMASKFGQLGGPEAHKALEILAQDESGMVQVAAVGALNTLATLEARFQLRETYARDEDPHVRQAVVQSDVPVGESAALGKLHATLAYQSDPHKRALAIYNAMLEVGKAVVPTLHDLWKTETEPEVRKMLVDLLAKLGEEQERQLLLTSLLQEPSFLVRRDIVRISTKWGGSETRQVFLTALPQESDEILQIALIRALAQWKDRGVARALLTHQLPPCSMTVYKMIQEAIEPILKNLPLAELGVWLPQEQEAMIRLRIVKEIRQREAAAREILLAAFHREQDPSVRAELIEAVAVWADEEEIRTLLYQCLRRGEKNRGVFTILRILRGYYPAEELNRLSQLFGDCAAIQVQ
ncbi:HEAT repeat domain-containing protein [Armatimonas sp.]|uniref:HEAT repeat domain-containing protein n=1 Tax=Armatimonas sp. TaxID=1872638 RepID=UPI00374D40F7